MLQRNNTIPLQQFFFGAHLRRPPCKKGFRSKSKQLKHGGLGVKDKKKSVSFCKIKERE